MNINVQKSNQDFEMSSANLTQRTEVGKEEDDQMLNFKQENQNNKQNKNKTSQQQFDEKVEKARDWAVYIKDKLESLAWISGALAVIYYSNFFHVFFYHEKINILFSNIFLFCIALNAVFAFYAAVILPYVLKVDIPVDKYQPKIIYIGAISGFIAFLSLVIAIWPAFGWYSPFMVFILFIGFLNCAAFLPSNQFGSILFAVIFIGAFYSHYLIDHDGHLHDK